jgi:hypothetical protein
MMTGKTSAKRPATAINMRVACLTLMGATRYLLAGASWRFAGQIDAARKHEKLKKAELRRGLARLPIAGPKPDQGEEQNTRTQPDYVGPSDVAVVPGHPGNQSHNGYDNHHDCQ